MVILPEAIIDVYGTDDYEWNHHELPTGEIYEFPNAKLFIKRFLKSLHMFVEENTSVKGFLPLSENFIGEIDPEHSIFQMALA